MASRPGLLDVTHRGERCASTQAIAADVSQGNAVEVSQGNTADVSDSVMVAKPVVSPSGRLVCALNPSTRRTLMTGMRSRPQATGSRDDGEAVTSAQPILLSRMDTIEFKVVQPLGRKVTGLQPEVNGLATDHIELTRTVRNDLSNRDDNLSEQRKAHETFAKSHETTMATLIHTDSRAQDQCQSLQESIENLEKKKLKTLEPLHDELQHARAKSTGLVDAVNELAQTIAEKKHGMDTEVEKQVSMCSNRLGVLAKSDVRFNESIDVAWPKWRLLLPEPQPRMQARHHSHRIFQSCT